MLEEPAKLTEEQKLEVGHMLLEGVSLEGIKVIMDAWMKARAEGDRCFEPYAAYVEYGLPPIDDSKTVEGSISKNEES